MFYRFILIVLLAVTTSNLYAQSISGYIKDEKDMEAIPFAHAWIKGTTNGKVADADGHFVITASGNDTLSISSVGYTTKEIPLKNIKNNPVTILLSADVQNIDEVTVKPEVPRAKELFKEILKNKKDNRDRISSVDNYKTFARTTVYIAIDTASKIDRIIDNLEEVTLEMDSMHLRFSPIYLAELDENITG